MGRFVASKAYRRASCVVLRGHGEFEVAKAQRQCIPSPIFSSALLCYWALGRGVLALSGVVRLGRPEYMRLLR